MLHSVIAWLELLLDRKRVAALECGLAGTIIVVSIVVGFRLMESNLSTNFNIVGAGP